MVDKLVWVIVVLAIIFLITYNPGSGTLNNIIAPQAKTQTSTCCANDDFRAKNPKKCEDPHYNGVQFANTEYACPKDFEKAFMGAIIQT